MQLLSLFHEEIPVGLKDIGINQEQHGVQAKIRMPLDCQQHERVHHRVHLSFVEKRLSFEYVNGAGYMHKTLK